MKIDWKIPLKSVIAYVKLGGNFRARFEKISSKKSSLLTNNQNIFNLLIRDWLKVENGLQSLEAHKFNFFLRFLYI